MPQYKPNNSSLKEQLNELQSEETQGMLLHKHNNKPVIAVIGKNAKEQLDKALALAFKEQCNRPIVIETPLSNTDELIRQAELASHQLHIATNFRTEDEHKLMLANQKYHKSLHNLPQGYHNVPTLVDKEPNSEDLHKNSSDDSKAQSVLAEVQQSLHNNKETTFTIKNPYAPIEPIEEAEYYKQNAEYYLKEYQLIQQKQSKLSSTKRRKIVEIVEKYLLT